MLTNLFAAELPAWTSVVFTAAGAVLMALYHHFLERRSKRLDHQLQKENVVFEKQLAFMQDRHSKRLDALDRLGHFLMEFDHAVRHIAGGGIGYSEELHDFYAKARTLGRETESLLGPSAYQAVIAWTDTGRKVLDASFVVTERTAGVAKQRGLPLDRLAELEALVGTKHAVRDGGASILQGYDDDQRSTWKRTILETCELSEEFDQDAYNSAVSAFHKVRDEITRTLPAPPAYPGS